MSKSVDPLVDLIWGYKKTSALSAACRLGIFDALKVKKSLDELCKTIQCPSQSTFRLLRLLECFGLVEISVSGDYFLTDLGRRFCSDEKDSLHAAALQAGMEYVHRTWENLDASIKNDGESFSLVNGAPLFEYLDRNPDLMRVFNSKSKSMLPFKSLLESFHFPDWCNVLDVGGGSGELVIELAQSFPHIQCAVFDLPTAVQNASAKIEAMCLSNRISCHAGSFFDDKINFPMQSEKKLIILKEILHDWSDENAAAILRFCAASMTRECRLLVVERVVSEKFRESDAIGDITMLVMLGGKERTEQDFTDLATKENLRLECITNTSSVFSLLIFQKY